MDLEVEDGCRRVTELSFKASTTTVTMTIILTASAISGWPNAGRLTARSFRRGRPDTQCIMTLMQPRQPVDMNRFLLQQIKCRTSQDWDVRIVANARLSMSDRDTIETLSCGPTMGPAKSWRYEGNTSDQRVISKRASASAQTKLRSK